MLRKTALTVAAALLVACGSPVQNPVTGVTERSALDERAEIEEGRKSHRQVLEEYGVVADPALQAYVNGIGQKLARLSHRPNLPWTFTVLDSPEVNAFALPGGYVYVTRGIMAYLDGEADLAGVLGHEIGHVTARHAAQRVTREQAAGYGVLAASVLGILLEGAGLSGAGQAASQVSQTAAAGYIARYGREQELQADQLGAEYLARARYSPRNMVDVIRVLKDQERFAEEVAKAEGRSAERGDNWLASHPSNDQRLAEIVQTAAKYPDAGYVDDGRTRYLRAINGMTFGESAEQGLTRGRNFYHEQLGIALTAPQGWKVQNSPDRITLVNRERNAGLVVRLVPPKAGDDHEEVIRNLLKPERGNAERFALGPSALPATRFTGERRDDEGQLRRVQATVVTGPGQRMYMLGFGASDAQALAASRDGLRAAESSLRAMSAAERAAARPWVLRSAPLPRGGFAELARRSPLETLAEQQLRLLNAAYGEGEVRAGQPVKVVE